MKNQMDTSALCRPVVYITVRDPVCRSMLVDALEREGWAVIAKPTGFHLIQAIADMIEGRLPWRDPSMIIVDAIAPGCMGTTIAAGLRDLGIAIPIVLVREPGQRVSEPCDAATSVVDRAAAVSTITELARSHGLLRVREPRPPQRASA